jgi:hypothetical protein
MPGVYTILSPSSFQLTLYPDSKVYCLYNFTGCSQILHSGPVPQPPQGPETDTYTLTDAIHATDSMQRDWTKIQ